MAIFNTLFDVRIKSIDHVYERYQILNDDCYGTTSTIFKYKNGKLLKIFPEPIYDNMYRNLKYINTLKTKVLSKIHSFVKIDGYRIGYIVDEMPGRNLLEIPTSTNVRSFISSMKSVEDDINLLSENNILTSDLKPANLMYDINSNKSSIIDQDCYIRLNDEPKELISLSNFNSLYLSILETLIKPIKNEIDQEFYDYLVGIILNRFDYTISIDKFYGYIIGAIEGYFDKEVKSIEDVRKLFKSY